MYRSLFPSSVVFAIKVPAADARTKNNLRFIEMQRGEPLVILFHHHQRRHPLRLRAPFRVGLIRPVFFCLAICSEQYGVEVRKENYDRATIRRQEGSVRDGKKGARAESEERRTECRPVAVNFAFNICLEG